MEIVMDWLTGFLTERPTGWRLGKLKHWEIGMVRRLEILMAKLTLMEIEMD